ncbi:hypothetical protein FNF28_07816 [Cafeteria roenbergensis]|uniref:Uncharacterized protein n=1 Tax=Cafeteria roenbergensis TaxID=33653 RepID=A0A5A8BYS1_CAFRO|nr:hypothetical protein FNF28_07816 [Cafeteria roenbergensis]
MAAAAATEDRLLLALADASDSGNTAEVSRLLDAGAPVNGMWPTAYGKTPLIRASSNGHVGIVRMLLDRGASVDATDDHGRTALMWASCCGRVEIVRMLLDRGASVDATDDVSQPACLAAPPSTLHRRS